MNYKEKIDHIIAMLEKHGYIEHWPPSQTCWHYQQPLTKKQVSLHWPTARAICWNQYRKKTT